MRVVSGSAKGKSLLSVPGDSTRPILDRVKTALFDVLRPDIKGISLLDLFAGSGSVGIEALSQGAAHCTFLDLNAKAVATIKTNLERCGFAFGSKQSLAEVRHTDAFTYLRNTVNNYDLIYIAPPQYENLWVQAMQLIAERPERLKAGGQIVVQIDPREYESLALSEFIEVEQRKYGNTLLVFYRRRK